MPIIKEKKYDGLKEFAFVYTHIYPSMCLCVCGTLIKQRQHTIVNKLLEVLVCSSPDNKEIFSPMILLCGYCSR